MGIECENLPGNGRKETLVVCWNCLDIHPLSNRRWWKDKHGNLTLLKACPKCERTTIMRIIEV